MHTDQINILQKNLQKVQNDIKQYSNHLTDKAMLLAVSKYHQPNAIKVIFNAGVNNFAENFVQEAIPKIKYLPDEIIWHYTGAIQSNKIKKIAENFNWVHTLTNLTHAKKLDKQCSIFNKKMQVLIQINVDLDPHKSGILLHNQTELYHLVSGILQDCPNLNLQGISCMLKNTGDYNQQCNSFMKMYKLRQKINTMFKAKLTHLSMGTSTDMKAAIRSGSTIIRIGTAIFGHYLKIHRHQ